MSTLQKSPNFSSGGYINPYGVELIIGHDLDGNLGDWTEAVKRAFRKQGLNIPDVEVDQWNGWRNWGMTDEEFFLHYAEAIKDGLLETLELFPYQREFLVEVAKRGHKNIIVTNRFIGIHDNLAQQQTLKWVYEKFEDIPIDGVIFSADKAIIPTDVFFDDSTENIDNLLKAGCPMPILIDQPYNRDRIDLDPIRCGVDGNSKLELVLMAEQLASAIIDPMIVLDPEIQREDPSLLAPLSEAVSYLEAHSIPIESGQGRVVLDEAYAEIQRSVATSLNQKLRVR